MKLKQEGRRMGETKLFGTSGIRGTLEEVTPELAYKVGLTTGDFFRSERIILGIDHRPQARLLQQPLTRGIIETGTDVIDVGKVPTPVLLVGQLLFNAPAIMITGSHTPSEIIGLLFFKEDTSEITPSEEERFEQKLFNNQYKKVGYENLGNIERTDITVDYMDYVLSKIDLSLVEGRKVVVDPGNGSASGFLTTGLDRAGVDTVTFNNFPAPTFPNRSPFPHPKNLRQLGRITKVTGGDLGIATDGDGDRAIFADEKGNVLWGDVSGAIFAADAVKRYKTKKVAITVNSSNRVSWAVKNAGGEPKYSAIGPPAIIAKMKEENAPFGIEQSGKNLWAEAFYYGDALLSTLRMLEILERSGSTLSELANKLPSYHMKKIAIECPEKMKEKVLERSVRAWRKREENAEIVDIDGKKIIYEDSWLLLRPSGTEPVFRVFAEAKKKERVMELIEMGKELVEKALKKVSGR